MMNSDAFLLNGKNYRAGYRASKAAAATFHENTLCPSCSRGRNALSGNGKERKVEEYGMDLTEEHRAMMILLDDLEVSGWDFKFWRNRLRPFREIIVVHLRKEEEIIISHMSEYFSQSEIDELSKGFEVVRKRELTAN